MVLKPATLARAVRGTVRVSGLPSYYDDSHRRFRADLRKFSTRGDAEAVALDARGTHPSPDLWRKLGARGVLASRVQSGPWLKDVVGTAVSRFGGAEPGSSTPPRAHRAKKLGAARRPGVRRRFGRGVRDRPSPRASVRVTLIAKRVGRHGLKQAHLPRDQRPEAGPTSRTWRARRRKRPTKVLRRERDEKWITNECSKPSSPPCALVNQVRSWPRCCSWRGKRYRNKTHQDELLKPRERRRDVKTSSAEENLLKKEGDGFRLIMHNFNHERWYIVAGVNRVSRLIIEECLKWSRQLTPETLADQPVIRQSSLSSSQVEGVQAWLEAITYRWHMSHAEQAARLAGPIALLKLLPRAWRTTSAEACQIFGAGRPPTGWDKSWRGSASVKFGAILGGSGDHG